MMSPEVAGITGLGIVPAVLILLSARARAHDIAGLRARMARLERLFEGYRCKSRIG